MSGKKLSLGDLLQQTLKMAKFLAMEHVLATCRALGEASCVSHSPHPVYVDVGSTKELFS